MAVGSVRSRKQSRARRAMGAEEMFNFPWPGPGNSEGPVDPDPWVQVQIPDDPFVIGPSASLLTTSPWPGPGNSEA
jgi:hypothetical protein